MEVLTPKININKIGIISRDYRKREENGFRDFSHAFESILTTLDEQACDSVLFSLYTLEKRPSFDVLQILKRLNIESIKAVFIEEFKDDGEKRTPIEYVIYLKGKHEWREQRLAQNFARAKEMKKTVVESFKKEVEEQRLFGNFTVLICGESNIVKYKMATKNIEDPHQYRASLNRDIKVILNPIHDRMTRHEMKLKREYLSRHNRWVLSVWNKGRSDKNGKVKNYRTPDWTVFCNGEERELKPIQCNVSSQADIQIGIIYLHGENDQV